MRYLIRAEGALVEPIRYITRVTQVLQCSPEVQQLRTVIGLGTSGALVPCDQNINLLSYETKTTGLDKRPTKGIYYLVDVPLVTICIKAIFFNILPTRPDKREGRCE